jgi:TatD DNase family protein
VIDFHCHVDLFPDPLALLQEAELRRVYVLAVTTTPKSWDHLNRLIGDRARIKAAVGLHPELVAERASEVELLCSIAQKTRYIGEIGLDGSPHLKNSFALQQRVFEKVLKCCSELEGRILSIHSRRAASQVLDLLEAHPRAGTPVLHWFSGTVKELDRAIRLGAWFSVGPGMLRSAKGLRLLEGMPRGRVVTESDGPFTQIRNRPVTPHDMGGAEQSIAKAWMIPLEEAKRSIRANFKELVKERVP